MTTTQTLKPAFEENFGAFGRRVLLAQDVSDWLIARDRTFLPVCDTFGYEMAYFPVTLTYSIAGELLIDDEGEPMVRQFTGDVLCGECAAKFSDDAYYIAYQINGEIGDMDKVYCADCGEPIYKPFED